MSRFRMIAIATVLLVLATGCQRQIMPTPNLYRGTGLDPFDAVPAAQQDASVGLLFATDRLPSESGTPWGFGPDRDFSIHYGACTIVLGDGTNWPKVSTDLLDANAGTVSLRPGEVKHFGGRDDDFRTALRERLDASERKDVLLYVHGFNNSFQIAAERLAGVWHFLGRPGVPLLFSWPSRDEVSGYLADRDSVEFAVAHFKQVLLTLSAEPTIARVHIIAHSSGAELVTTAVRELHLLNGANVEATRAQLRLGQVILAAADVDTGVIQTRVIEEGIHLIPDHVTLYVSRNDGALNLSRFLRAGMERVGVMDIDGMDEPRRRLFEQYVENVDIIDASGIRTGPFAHAYFVDSPAVSADIMLILRYAVPLDNPVLRPLAVLSGATRLRRIHPSYLREPSDEWLTAMRAWRTSHATPPRP